MSNYHSDEKWIVLVGAGAISFIIFMGYLAVKSEQSWREYAQVHCKIVGRISGSTSFGIGTNGNMTTIYTPDKTGYQCDDGVTYWR